MKTPSLLLVMLALLAFTTTPANSQIAQLELSVFGGRITDGAFEGSIGGGAGAIIARKFFAGARYIRVWGSFSRLQADGNLRDENNGGNVVAADLGFVLLERGIEIRAEALAGAVGLTQTETIRPVTGPPISVTENKSTQGLFAPGLVITLPLFGTKLGGEIYYFVVGDPGFTSDYDKNGLIFFLRWAYAFGS